MIFLFLHYTEQFSLFSHKDKYVTWTTQHTMAFVALS